MARTPYRWYLAFIRKAYATNHPEHQRLGQLYYRIAVTQNKDHIARLTHEGLQLAVACQQPYWELYFRYRRYMTSPEYGALKDDIVQLVVDLSQPRYQDCPLNARIYYELLFAYSQTDALGYASEILDGIQYIETSLFLDDKTRLELLWLRADVYFHQRQWQLAYTTGQVYLQDAQALEDSHHITNACIHLLNLLIVLDAPLPAWELINILEATLIQSKQVSWMRTLNHLKILLSLWVEDIERLETALQHKAQWENQPLYQEVVYGLLKGLDLKRNVDKHLLKSREFAQLFDHQSISLDLQLRHYALIKQISWWRRWLYLAYDYTPIARLSRTYPRLSNIMTYLFIPIFPLVYFVLFGMGFWMEYVGGQVRQIRQDILDLVQESSAKAIYEARLARIDAGDMTHLS